MASKKKVVPNTAPVVADESNPVIVSVHSLSRGHEGEMISQRLLVYPDGRQIVLADVKASLRGFECTTEDGEKIILPPANKELWDQMWQGLVRELLPEYLKIVEEIREGKRRPDGTSIEE